MTSHSISPPTSSTSREEMSTTLGKRKGRDEDSISNQTHGSVCIHPRWEQSFNFCSSSSTLFVSNLPYSATSTDLNTLFSDIGPVRSAFVVLEHATGSSKGVGYVSFAIREDAQAAFDKVNESGEGLVLDGRKLRVQWAGSKVCYENQTGCSHHL